MFDNDTAPFAVRGLVARDESAAATLYVMLDLFAPDGDPDAVDLVIDAGAKAGDLILFNVPQSTLAGGVAMLDQAIAHYQDLNNVVMSAGVFEVGAGDYGTAAPVHVWEGSY